MHTIIHDGRSRLAGLPDMGRTIESSANAAVEGLSALIVEAVRVADDAAVARLDQVLRHVEDIQRLNLSAATV